MTIAISKRARFDTKLSKQQKALLEKASALGGYRDMTDFMIQAAQEKAKEIIMEREQIIASEKDSEVFFNAVMNPDSPNEPLRKAVEQYKSHFSE